MAADQKGARRSGRAVAFRDETGHTFRARVGTTWAPIGHPPVLRRRSQRREVSSIAALVAPLDGPARLYARHFTGSVHGAQVISALRYFRLDGLHVAGGEAAHGAQVISALRYFRRCIGRPLVIVWDGLSAHHAQPVQDFLAAHPEDYQLEWLPGYAPELNPEELCNAAVKTALRNTQPGSVAELRRLARREFSRLARRTAELESFFRHVGLSVN